MKILLLDDSTERYEQFKSMLSPRHELRFVQLAGDFQKAIQHPFDVVFLDHDLGDLIEQERVAGMYGSRAYDGMDAVHDLCDAIYYGAIKPRFVVVHSWNEDGARGMVSRLEENEIDVRQHIFGSQKFVELVRGL